jgi:hypothetical protein
MSTLTVKVESGSFSLSQAKDAEGMETAINTARNRALLDVEDDLVML